DAVLEAAHVNLAIKAGETLFELLQIADEEGDEASPVAMDRRQLDLTDQVTGDLGKVANALGIRLPICIVIDDVQFSASDPSSTDLFAKLLADAILSRWPLLIILTCWVEEWLRLRGPAQD